MESYSQAMREGPEFVFWFMKWGLAFVAVLVVISVGLFLLLRRWSHKQARLEDDKTRAPRGS
jgi:hypothetical protein